MEEESKKEKVCESNTPAAGLLPENPPTIPVKKPTPKFSQPLMGLLPTPTIPPLIPQPLLGLPAPAILPTIQLSQLLLAAALPKPRIKPLMSFEIPTALQTNLKPNFGTMVQGAPKTTLQTNPQTIKPLMELSVEVPAALKAKLPQFGATKPSVKTRSNTATSQPVDTQPKNKSLLQVTKPAAGPVLESYMSNITSHNPAIKPLMELSVEVPAALKEKFEQFGATMSPVETGSDATDTSLCEDTQPNNESSLQDSIPAAGTDLESSSSNKTRGRNKVKMSRPKSWQRYTSPGGSRYWPRFATRWLDYSRVGNPLRGTPFICFKTPLKPSFDNKVEPKDRFTTDDLMNIVPNLGLVIDLTATDRYNDVSEYRKRGIKYKKVMCQGHVVPNINSVKAFFNAVDEYVMIPQAAGKLIGVHCTHGVNRTGYLVCRYMIQRLGFQPETAISEFEDARGHGIERNEYKDHLKSELENMPFYVRNAGMNRFLKMNFGPKHTDTGIPNLNCRKDGPVELMNAPRNEFVPMDRGTERQTFPPENEVRSNWQSGPPSQYPETDLRNRLSSNTRIPSSNFFGKESSNEMGPEPPYQKTFYPRSNPGNQQFPAGPSTSGLGAREPGLGPNQTLHPRAEPGPQQIFHKGSSWAVTKTDRKVKRKTTCKKVEVSSQDNSQNKKIKLGVCVEWN